MPADRQDMFEAGKFSGFLFYLVLKQHPCHQANVFRKQRFAAKLAAFRRH